LPFNFPEISKDGKVIYQRSTGNARIDDPVTQLLEEKKLSINEKLSNYFPQLPNAGEITISMLLNHRSGLPDFTKNTDFDNWKEKPKSHEELLALISSRKPDFEPKRKMPV